MDRGVYSTARVKRMRMLPCCFRCADCGALNAGSYPIAVSDAVRQQKPLNDTGRELTDAERAVADRKAGAADAGEARTAIVSGKWNGSPNAVALCGACGQKTRWSRPAMRSGDWIACLLIPFCIGLYELVYEGFYTHEPRAVLFGTLLLAMSAVLMLAVGLMLTARKRRINRLPADSLPAVFDTVEGLEEHLRDVRREAEPLFRFIDPRSPEAASLREENASARENASPEPWVLCKYCMRAMAPGDARAFGGRAYCPDCYGLVRQAAEARSYSGLHRKRGGDIR